MIRRSFVAALAALALSACQTMPTAPAAVSVQAAQAAVEAALADSVAGWNAGDMDRFLGVYSADPQTSYVGGKDMIRGKAALARNYEQGYDFSNDAARGTLSIETVEFRRLGPDHALLIGRYTVDLAEGEDATGLTSLVFERQPGGWKIIADHSS